MIASLSLEMGWSVTPKWVPSEENPADKPSRAKRDYDDYRLDPRLLQDSLLRLQCKQPSIDLMTTHAHRQCHRFLSRTLQPESVGVDVFARPLSELPDKTLYVNPPWSAIPRMLLHAATLRPDQQMVLVTPRWELQQWWQHLCRIRSRSVTVF